MDKKKNKIIRQLIKFKEKIQNKFRIEKIILFGSRARGDYKKDSDVDIIIVSKDFEKVPFLDRTRGLYIMWDLNYRVDILCYTPREYRNLKNKISVLRSATKEGIEIPGR